MSEEGAAQEPGGEVVVYESTDRVVRVGTHTGANQLPSRLAQHFLKPNKDRSIFRKNIGRALLNRAHDPFLEQWEIDLTPSGAKQRYWDVIDFARLKVVEADVSFDESGEPKTGPRSVPIPPELVEMLRRWVEDRGIGRDERLFRTRNGNRPAASNWSRAWQRALRQVGHEPLRVYDCRHAAATTWLQAGVPLGEVARRLGHSVETLVSTYVGALAGDEALANEKIETALHRSA